MVDIDDQIYVRDFTDAVKELPDCTFDLAILDPPYNIGKDFGNDSDRMKMSEYIDLAGFWIQETMRVLKPAGTMFIYGFDEILARLSAFIPIDQQRWLVWHYTNKNVANLNFWQRSHESIICAWKDKSQRIFNVDAVREPYTEGFVKGSAGRRRPATGTGRGGQSESTYNANPLGALPRDVMDVPALAGGSSLSERIIWCETCQRIVPPTERGQHLQHDLVVHPTQKPRRLTERLIKSCRPAGGFRALIPFCGSGSECLCVRDLGGRFVSFDLNERYVKMARAKMAESGIIDDDIEKGHNQDDSN